MLLTSRSFEEYAAFFDLDVDRLPDRVLDCCAGASSFVAGGCVRGVDAIAADPLYINDEQILTDATTAGATGGSRLIAAHQDRFSYAWYGSAQRRDTLRATAAEIFREHRHRHPERYIAASLPALPFADKASALALCSHLLFSWADRLDEQWHLDSLVELCRVAAEVRVFPLLAQGGSEPVRIPAPAAAPPPSRLRHQEPDHRRRLRIPNRRPPHAHSQSRRPARRLARPTSRSLVHAADRSQPSRRTITVRVVSATRPEGLRCRRRRRGRTVDKYDLVAWPTSAPTSPATSADTR
jgi:hypothetical protein